MKQHRLVHLSRHNRLWVTLALLALLAGMNWFQQQAVKLRADPAVVPATVHITIPEKGTLVTETTTIQASVSDDQSVAKVEFYIGDELVSTVTASPYQATVDLSRHVGQAVTLRAVAYDRALNDVEDSASVAVVRTPKVGTATFQTTTISIPTYPYTPFLHLRYDGPYPYRWLDWGHYGNTTSAPQNYQLLVLDNDYLRVTLLPELGGRVYQMIWKPTGHNELYQNPVIKPTHWGPLKPEENWWLAAGGIEWGLPVEEHGYEWGEPWAWNVITSTSGVTVTVRDTQASDRLRAAIDLVLPADRAYLAVTPHLENPTAAVLAFKYWTNAMLAPGASNTVSPDLRFIFSSNEVTVHSSGDAGSRVPNAGDPMPWPIYKGRDFSRLGNWRQWFGFFERPQAATDFIGVYDTASNEGVARIFPSHIVRGTKGFGMGWSEPIDPGTWTDDGSAYVELHGGVAPTFWDSAQLAAGATLTWTEYWYPMSSIGILSTATAEAVLGIYENGGSLNIGLHSTEARAEGKSTLRVWEEATCTPLTRLDLPAIDPAHPFTTLVPIGGRTLDQVTVGYLDDQGNVLAGHRPANCPTPEAHLEPLPPWVETTTFTVTWAKASDATYHIQFRDGYEAAWTDWLTSTRAISATFTGEHGHTYLFRARNLSIGQPFTDEEWGQAFTTVLTQPAPVLVTSRKTAKWDVMPMLSGTIALPVQVVSYTVLISNTGNLAAGAIISDPVPLGMSVIPQSLTADSGLQPVYADGVIQWNGAVHPGESVRLRFALAPAALRRGDKITNTAEIAGSVLGPFTRLAVTVWAWPIFLPVVSRP